MEQAVEEVIPSHMREQWETARSVDFAMSIDVTTRFRVNAFHTRGLIAFAFRLLELEAKTFEMLTMPPVCARLASAYRGRTGGCEPHAAARGLSLQRGFGRVERQPGSKPRRHLGRQRNTAPASQIAAP